MTIQLFKVSKNLLEFDLVFSVVRFEKLNSLIFSSLKAPATNCNQSLSTNSPNYFFLNLRYQWQSDIIFMSMVKLKP